MAFDGRATFQRSVVRVSDSLQPVAAGVLDMTATADTHCGPDGVRWARGAAVWLGLVVAETLHGIARTLLLAPRVGDFRARQIAVFTGSVLILAIAYATVRWIGARSTRELLALGIAWLAGMLTFEITFGRWVARQPWERILADYDLVHGGLLPIGMAMLALSPLLADSIHRRARRRPERARR